MSDETTRAGEALLPCEICGGPDGHFLWCPNFKAVFSPRAPAASAVADEVRIRAEEAEACAKIAFNDGCGRPDCRACYGGNIAAKIRERIPSTESARLAAEKQVIEAAVHYLKIAGDGNKSQFISENGRFGKSPWQEFREAVTRLTAPGAGGK